MRDQRWYTYPTASDWVAGRNGKFSWQRWCAYTLHDFADWWVRRLK